MLYPGICAQVCWTCM